jgi:3-hydroxyacyl-[acyl-carrier-protein] dehydratase
VRYLLVDRIDELKKFEWATGVKCVTLADDCFEHHFPSQPVYPGALLVESLAQLGGALLELSLRDVLDYTPRCVLSSVKAKFRGFARPGDALALRADVISRHDDSALVQARACRGEERLVEAEILFVYLRVDDPRLAAARNDFLDVVTRATQVVA